MYIELDGSGEVDATARSPEAQVKIRDAAGDAVLRGLREFAIEDPDG